ncbi:hypothetical protein Tco_1177144 [Tanacetum coccineum]
MHVKIIHKVSGRELFCSFIYANNLPIARRSLWADLELHKNVTHGKPWILMGELICTPHKVMCTPQSHMCNAYGTTPHMHFCGVHNTLCGVHITSRDFNVVLNLEDYSSGSSKLNYVITDFKDCVYNIEVMDINSSGLHFTWNQKPKGGSGLLKKLDRIMGNTEFIDAFPGAYALFQPYIISDHSPAVLNILNLPFNKPKPFKIFNFLAHKSQFRELVSNVDGHMMYQVVSKLKALKKPFRKLLHDQGNLHDRVNKLRFELDEVQKALDLNPNDLSLREEEAVYVQAFSEAKLDEERFSAYFHKSVKSRIHRGRIDVIMNSDNIEVTGSNVADVFVSHYQMFLGSDMVCDNLNMDGLFLKKVSADSFSNMVRPVTDEEIKAAMFSIGDEHY